MCTGMETSGDKVGGSRPTVTSIKLLVIVVRGWSCEKGLVVYKREQTDSNEREGDMGKNGSW